MTKPEQPKPIPLPVLLVFGKPTSPDLPQASWFRAEDRPAVISAAQSMKCSVLDIQTDAERPLTLDVHEGVLKGNGRMIVGSISPEVYKRIEDYAAKTSTALASKAFSDTAQGAKALPEQNANILEKGPLARSDNHAPSSAPVENVATAPATSPSGPKPEPLPARDPWDAVRIGSHVIGKYWEEDGQPMGWWVGVITDFDRKDFYIRWPDEPLKPALRIERKHVAILHPSFDVAREWDRKR